jgi:hypothetical protein
MELSPYFCIGEAPYCGTSMGWGQGHKGVSPQGLWAGVNQQPPVHQFRMRPFKLFWGWTKNTSSSPAQGFFSPLPCPKIFPTYLPPTPLTSFPARSISRAGESSWAWVAQSFEEMQDARHKAWGRWRAQHWRNMERRRQEECFIPNVEAGKER